MNELRDVFRRQAEWQKKRVSLSWPEKIRLAEGAQETLRRFREMKTNVLSPSRDQGGGQKGNA